MGNVIYEGESEYDVWLKIIIVGTLAATFVLGVIFIFTDKYAAIIMFAVTLFDAVLFWAILPRKYQILVEGLRIVLGGPFTMNLPYSTITEVRQSCGHDAYIYWGIRFATSGKTTVEIVRNKGMNVVISPHNRDAFLEQVDCALAAWRAHR